MNDSAFFQKNFDRFFAVGEFQPPGFFAVRGEHQKFDKPDFG
jgi:hypothetical protein